MAAGKESGRLELVGISVGLFLGLVTAASTLFVAMQSNNTSISAQALEDKRLTHDRVTDLYDRTILYLSAPEENPRWGRALVELISLSVEGDARETLESLIASNTRSSDVAAKVLALNTQNSADPSQPSNENLTTGVVLSRGDANLTDLTVYLCESKYQSPAVNDSLGAIARTSTALAETGSFGVIKGSVWRNFDDFEPTAGTTTVVYDESEADIAASIQGMLQADGAPVALRLNTGETTQDFLSVIVCI